MNFMFSQKKITGIMTILPANETRFDDEVMNYNFPPAKSMRLKTIMGYDRHRIATEGTCVSDLCVFGLKRLLEEGLLDPADIDGLILVTQTPDYLMPPTSSVIHGRLGLKQDMICLDINQGCAGFIIGLIQAFLLLEQPEMKKIVLLNADILSRKTSRHDRNSYPLIGDAASVTIVERDLSGGPIFANVKVDGSRSEALMIPAGGLRLPSSPETAVMLDAGDGNLRSRDNLVMDGMEIFNFVQTEIPEMIEDILKLSQVAKADVDFYMFHQPNRFILEKLADQLQVLHAKLPNNIVQNFGNASGVTIPTNITYNLGARLLTEKMRLCLAGFGTGLTWSSMILDMGMLDFCRTVDY